MFLSIKQRGLRWLRQGWLWAAWLAVPAFAQVPFEVSGALGWQSLDSSIEVLEDPARTLELDAVRALTEERWSAPRSLPLNIGYSPSAWWVRLRLHNASTEEASERFLQVRSAVQDWVALSVVSAEGRVQTFPITGDREPFSTRVVASSTPVFPLRLQPDETVTIFLRLSTHDGLHEQVPLVLWSRASFFEASQTRTLWLGAYYGLTLVLLIYSGFMFIMSRQRIAGFYAAYLAAILGWSATFSGHALQYLWPGSPAFNNQVLPLFMALAFFFGLRFSAEWLQLAQRMPKWFRATRWLAWANLLASVPAVFGQYVGAFAISLPVGAVTGLLQGALCIVLLRQGFRPALWSFIAWGALLLSVVAYILEMLGWIQPNPFLTDALIIGCALQVLLLGLGFADAAESMRSARLTAEQSARLEQAQLAASLERQFKQRTQELERANQRLGELAITDALTGAFNRRHFNERLESVLQRPRWAGESPALCLLDVDHFKLYNDLYGHSKGDKVLAAIAATLRSGLRRADDHAFRVGGEEFALILQPGDMQAHREQVEALRRAIEALQMPHAGSAAGVVTASFGVVQMPVPGRGAREVSASALYKEADRLLYRAKEGGRNRVESAEQPLAQWAVSTDFSPESGPATA